MRRSMHEFLYSLLMAGYIICNLQQRQELKKLAGSFSSETNALLRQLTLSDKSTTAGEVVVLNEDGTPGEAQPFAEYAAQQQAQLAQLREWITEYQERAAGRNNLLEAFENLDYDQFWTLSPMTKLDVMQAMDHYMVRVLGSSLTLDNICNHTLLQRMDCPGFHLQHLASASILMGYLLRQEEMRYDMDLEGA